MAAAGSILARCLMLLKSKARAGVTTALARRDRDLLDQPREDLAALLVGLPLLALDRRPF